MPIMFILGCLGNDYLLSVLRILVLLKKGFFSFSIGKKKERQPFLFIVVYFDSSFPFLFYDWCFPFIFGPSKKKVCATRHIKARHHH